MGVLVVKLILIYLLFSALFDCCWSSLQSGLGGNATDRLALLAIKAQIKQDLHNYNAMSSWNESTHFCMWHGVTCSRRHRQRVTTLDPKSGRETIPNIGNLSFLRELRLQNNSFSHEIPPQIGNLRKLQVRKDGCSRRAESGSSTQGMAADLMYVVTCWSFPCACQYAESCIHWDSA